MKDLKEREVRDIVMCARCKRKLGEVAPTFSRVTVADYILNLPAIERQTGLAMMLGGNAVIAHAMGPDEDMALAIHEETYTLCAECREVMGLNTLEVEP